MLQAYSMAGRRPKCRQAAQQTPKNSTEKQQNNKPWSWSFLSFSSQQQGQPSPQKGSKQPAKVLPVPSRFRWQANQFSTVWNQCPSPCLVLGPWNFKMYVCECMRGNQRRWEREMEMGMGEKVVCIRRAWEQEAGSMKLSVLRLMPREREFFSKMW